VPALPYPKYGVKSLYLFTYYQSREDYRAATGQEPPAWDPSRPPKRWEDPSARASTRRNVVYDYALVAGPSGTIVPGPDGKPMVDVLVLKKEEAATVNIPPMAANVPGADVPEVPCPLRALEPGEELFFDIGGVVAVKNVDLYSALEIGFTAQDRAMLKAIAKKLGAEA
jgi:hypothetical protein